MFRYTSFKDKLKTQAAPVDRNGDPLSGWPKAWHYIKHLRWVLVFYTVKGFITLGLISACGSQIVGNINKSDADHVSVVFYNVENLFDTLDTPLKFDEEFLPDSVKQWGTERYETKLDHLAKVILAATEGTPPDLLGVCEIENEAVLRDLIGHTDLSTAEYGIVHFESPDMRGIDNALLYKKRKGGFQPDGSAQAIRLTFPFDTEYTSRDILYVRGTIGKGKRAERIHVYVNHWPSRRGGLQESMPRRLVAAKALYGHMDSVRRVEGPDALFLAMGDFNDEPDNNSLKLQLGALLEWPASPEAAKAGELYNLMGPDDAKGMGTYNYRGNWNMLDQFVVAGGLLDGTGWTVDTSSVGPFQAEWMMYPDERFGPTPSRSFGGPNYYAGYSDHLPITLTLQRNR